MAIEDADLGSIGLPPELLDPIVAGILAGDEAACCESIASARFALAASGLAEGAMEVAELDLRVMELQVKMSFSNTEEQMDAALQGLLEIGKAAYVHDRAKALASLQEYYARVALAIRDILPLCRSEFDSLLESALSVRPDLSTWYHAASWAFHSMDIEVLGHAFEEYLVNPDGVESDASWQRVNLMYHLVLGDAKEIDIEQYLRRISLVPQIQEFRKRLWPRAQSLGLTSPDLESLFLRVEEEVMARGDRKAHIEPLTKSILRK